LLHIDINPVLTLGPISIRWYGILLALAVVVLILWAVKEVRRTGFPHGYALTAALVALPSAIISTRLLHVIDYWDYYIQNPVQIIGASGLTAWGAVLGASLGIYIYSKLRGFPFGRLGDLLAPGVILAQAVGRVGCITNGCCYGVVTTSAPAVIYTQPESYAPFGIPVLPMPFFEIVYNLAVFSLLFKLRERFRPDGSLYLIYLSLYSVWRVGTDFFREGRPLVFNLHEAQVVGIITLMIHIPIMVRRKRWVKPETTED